MGLFLSPTTSHTAKSSTPSPPQVGPPHNWTLMDGEMVVDDIEDQAAGGQGGGKEGAIVKKQRRR